MRLITCLSFLLLLLGTHPANTMRYHSLENTLGQNYIHFLLDTDLTILNPASTIQSRDFTEIFVWDLETIFIGAAGYLLKINANFDIERTYSVDYAGVSCSSTKDTYLDTCDNYFRVFLNINNTLYTCYTNRESNPVCVALDPVTLAVESSPPMFDQMSGVDQGFISPSLPALLYQRNFAIYLTDFNDNPRLVTGSVFDGRERNRITVRDPFANTYITTTFYYFEEDATIRTFLNAASFARTAHNYLDVPNSHNYIYFMFYEPSDKLLSGTALSRVGRFCLEGPSDSNPTINTDIELPQMETFVKGELQCGDVYPSLVQDWLYVETGGEFYYYAVFSSLEKGPRTSYLCVYDLSEIRAVMDIVKTCNNNPGLLSGAITPMAGSPIVGHSGGLYTQLQRYTFDYNSVTYEMIYISLTDGSIIKYCINCVPTLVETIQVVPSYVIADNPDLSYLDRLQLNEDHLLAGGYTGLYKVPLQTCTSLGEDYNLCVGDPMCYYNSISNLCLAVTQSTPAPSNSILHLSGTLPVATCSDLTGHIIVDRIAITTNISLSWTCATANSIDIIIRFSDGSTSTIVTDETGNGSSTVDLTYLDLNVTLIDPLYIKPFLTHNTIPRALPGTNLYTNATYTVIQEKVQPTSCSPVPPICSPPVCVDNPSCGTFCSDVTIDCSASIINMCTEGIRYSIDNGTRMMAPANLTISVIHGDCGERGCLFQSYAYNSSTGEETAGTSHWLNLLLPLNQYTPVISAERTSTANQFAFSAAFTKFNSHTCETPVIATDPVSSPLTLTSCDQDITAVWVSTYGTSLQDDVRVFSSQPVLAPTNVQLSFSKTSSIDDCSYKADVTISWDHPDYDIKNEPQTMYIIEGTACSGSVTGDTTHACNDITISYNTEYTVSVTSLEPCFNRASAVNNTSLTSNESSLPAAPHGIAYTFSGDYLILTWSPPLCIPLNGALSYQVIVRRGLCDNCSQTETTNTYETNDTFLHIPLGGSSIYKYNITLQSKTNGMLSETVDLIIFTPVTSEFNCVDCRVERVRINSSTKIVTCESTAACDCLIISNTFVTLTKDSSTTGEVTSVSGGCIGLQYDLTNMLHTTGLYTISIRHYLKHSCTDATCTTENAKAFYYYISDNTPATAAPLSDICHDEKAYIILALAVIAIVCAFGNFGFMVVAFCVFCIPRRKVFRCC